MATFDPSTLNFSAEAAPTSGSNYSGENPNHHAEQLSSAADAARQTGLKDICRSKHDLMHWSCIKSIDHGDRLSHYLGKQCVPLSYFISKRIFDFVVSSILIVTLLPLFFLIALLIKLDSHGPAIFTQRRVGKNGLIFNIYKFRSMYIDTPRYDFSPTESYDRRITRIGRFLRRTSLDELPQLVNVFIGNMSLVGPRPEMPFIVRSYDKIQRQRLQATPGITGLWQLSADRAFQIHENIHYDLFYIQNRTFLADITILVHTLFFAMRGV